MSWYIFLHHILPTAVTVCFGYIAYSGWQYFLRINETPCEHRSTHRAYARGFSIVHEITVCNDCGRKFYA